MADGFEDKVGKDLEEIKRVQQALGDYTDVEFRKVGETLQRIRTMNTVSGIATIGLAALGTVHVAYKQGGMSARSVNGRVRMRR